MHRRIAFATDAAHRCLTPDDRLAAGALRRRGVGVEAVVWSDRAVPWDAFDAVIIRTTWDYTTNQAAFQEWLTHLETRGIPLWNPAPLIRWNLDKGYLGDLEAAGVPTIPTVRLARGNPASLAELLATCGWSDAVLKPSVSANGWDTHRVTPASAASLQPQCDALLAERDLLLQAFDSRVLTDGEWSLLFFGGAYSHAVRKRPADGEFRVQKEYGGRVTAEPAPAHLVTSAEVALQSVPGPWLYARVDGFAGPEGLTIVEIELVEPFLYFATQEESVERFASALRPLLRGTRT